MNTECPTFYEASQASLDSALRQALPDLPANRVARVRAAVAAFARMMQRPPDELPAHQGFIIHQMRRLRRGPTGLSLKTLSNTRSELIFLVRRTSGQGSRSALALSAEWAQFRDSLRHPPAWWSLSRLAAFSSQQGVYHPGVEQARRRPSCLADQAADVDAPAAAALDAPGDRISAKLSRRCRGMVPTALGR